MRSLSLGPGPLLSQRVKRALNAELMQRTCRSGAAVDLADERRALVRGPDECRAGRGVVQHVGRAAALGGVLDGLKGGKEHEE